MQERNPLDLPEIRNLLGPYLSFAALYSCVLVNKDWQDTFTPYLWASFTFGPLESKAEPPSETTIQNYGHLIKELYICKLTPQISLDLFRNTPLTRLKTIHLCPAPSCDSEPLSQQRFDWIVRQNPGLQAIKYDGDYLPASSSGDLAAILSSPALTDLTMVGADFERRHWEPFQQLCATRLERLSLSNCKFAAGLDWVPPSMPFLRELSITAVCGPHLNLEPSAQIHMIEQCPNLRTLRWTPTPAIPRVFLGILQACPQLAALELQRMILSDPEISWILDTMKASATEIIIPGRKASPTVGSGAYVGFGTRAFESLQRHFATLTVFDVGSQGSAVTSPMVLKVLTLCPNLREITACQVLAKEVRDGPGTWACRGLEVFKVMIRGFKDILIDRIRVAVFRRLGSLTRLRVLHIGTVSVQTPEHAVALRLDCGLGQLSGLRDLESVSVVNSPQKMRREDVDWIRYHWRTLKMITGELHPKKEISDAIREVLTDRRATNEKLDYFAFHTAYHRY
ncbi:hypothetical protein BGX33_003552 [Mortierella sp. NVP41]|nr:hypothetical protein BGX33_003552 [Mortierella sp. NVP41]